MKTSDEIIKAISEIPEERHPELLDIVRDFKNKAGRGSAKGKWSGFAGILTDEQAEHMLAVIEEAFEKV